MKSTICIFLIHFNDYALCENRLTQTWIHDRLALFMKFTVPCLAVQTSQSFHAFVKIDPSSTLLLDTELKRYDPLPSNITFTSTDDTWHSLIQNYKNCYLIPLDTDDLYHSSLVQLLYDHLPNQQTLIGTTGYLYDIRSQKLDLLCSPYVPYTIEFYHVDQYQNGFRFKTPFHRHSLLNQNYEMISNPCFIKLMHSSNCKSMLHSSQQMDTFIGSSLQSEILNSFGLTK